MKEFIEKLIGRLEELKTFKLNLADAMSELMKKDRIDNYISKEEVIEIVNQLAEEYNSGWIPCNEKLPEKNAIVLTCDKDGWISVKVNMPYAGVKNDFECGYYTAWMPLPPAYVPKEGRE